jgi:hypothetical protein
MMAVMDSRGIQQHSHHHLLVLPRLLLRLAAAT